MSTAAQQQRALHEHPMPDRSQEQARQDAFWITSRLGVPEACRRLGVKPHLLAGMCTGTPIPPRWRRFLHTARVMCGD